MKKYRKKVKRKKKMRTRNYYCRVESLVHCTKWGWSCDFFVFS